MFDFSSIKSPILLQGDETKAYRDPAVVYHGGVFHLFCTYVNACAGGPYMHVCHSRSTDLVQWSTPEILTPADKTKNFSSPGNCFYHNGLWYMCLQTYPRENGEQFGNGNSRIYLMRSPDLLHWDVPQRMDVKGAVPPNEMGRMIDPYILNDGRQWWCFYKQNGVSYSCSDDLADWKYMVHTRCGENVCVLPIDGAYIVFHSPANGIGMLKTSNFTDYEPYGQLITLNQKNWSWAKGRITAGFVLDLTKDKQYGKYLLFFHGSGPGDESVDFDKNASVGLAWSDDLMHWQYPV